MDQDKRQEQEARQQQFLDRLAKANEIMSRRPEWKKGLLDRPNTEKPPKNSE